MTCCRRHSAKVIGGARVDVIKLVVARLGFAKLQADDVVGVALVVALLRVGRDHVVGRRHQRASGARGIADARKRLDVGHMLLLAGAYVGIDDWLAPGHQWPGHTTGG